MIWTSSKNRVIQIRAMENRVSRGIPLVHTKYALNGLKMGLLKFGWLKNGPAQIWFGSNLDWLKNGSAQIWSAQKWPLKNGPLKNG